jgi:hypothetical protein
MQLLNSRNKTGMSAMVAVSRNGCSYNAWNHVEYLVARENSIVYPQSRGGDQNSLVRIFLQSRIIASATQCQERALRVRRDQEEATVIGNYRTIDSPLLFS